MAHLFKIYDYFYFIIIIGIGMKPVSIPTVQCSGEVTPELISHLFNLVEYSAVRFDSKILNPLAVVPKSRDLVNCLLSFFTLL